MSETPRPEPQIPDPVPILHPFLLALYPVVGLYAHNLGVTRAASMVRPIGLLFLLALLLLVVFTVILRRMHKAGVVSSIIILTGLSGWGLLSFLMRTTLPYVSMIPTPVYFVAYLVIEVAVVLGILWYWRGAWRKAIGYAVGFTVAFLAVPALAEFVFFGGPNRGMSWYVSVYLVVAALVLITAFLYKGDFVPWTRALNWFSFILTGLYLLLVLMNRSQLAVAEPPPLELDNAETAQAAPEQETLPDIYFLVLDGYPRGDELRRRLGFNNMMFESTMEQLGFHIPAKSHVNYTDPELAVGACLNLDYIHSLLPDATNPVAVRNGLYHHNRLFHLLKRQGYAIHAFSPGADSLEPRGRVDTVWKPPRSVSEFEQVLLANSVLSPILQSYYSRQFGNPAYWQVEPRRQRTLYAFETIAEMAANPSKDQPRFVMAHFLIPSPPFVFDRHGGRARPYGPGAMGGDTNFVGSESQFVGAYIDQIHYVNDALEELAENILEASSRPPVIIVASSRGFDPGADFPGMDQGSHRSRLAGLLMIYLPPDLTGTSAPYDTISLVNVFRVVLNRVCELEIPLLPDLAYETPADALLQFRRVAP